MHYCCNIVCIITYVTILMAEVNCFLITPCLRKDNGRKIPSIHFDNNKNVHRTLCNNNDDYEEGEGTYKRRRNVVIRRPVKRKEKLTSIDSNKSSSSNDKAGPNKSSSSVVVDETLFTNIEFGSKNNDDQHNISLHPETKRALIEDMKFTHMTQVQERTFVPIASEKMDVLVKARTGSGKTLAFLLPTLCQILEQKQTSTTSIDILILSPTRELATQIATVARQMTKYHYNLPVQVMYGGTSIARDIAIFQKETPRILVATPGRILDILQHKNDRRNKSKIQSEGRSSNQGLLLSQALSQNQILVLDEADRLLSPGFTKEVQDIISYLPRPKHRQTLLFSATISMNDINSLIQSTKNKSNNIYKNLLKDKYMMIDCCDDQDQNTIINQSTNANAKIQDSKTFGTYSVVNDNVKQSYIVLPNINQLLPFVMDIITTVINSEQNSKVIVFFPTARFVGFFAKILSSTIFPNPIKIFEMHSKKSQGFRTKTSQAFQKCTNGILLTSDVSARGVDYPDVTHVIQFGLPENRKQYIHRLGRTGRAGKEGYGLLVLFPFESRFVQKELKGLKLTRNEVMEKYLLVQSKKSHNKQVDLPVDAKSVITAQQAYVAFLGYYTDQINRTNIKSKEELVHIANEMATHVFGLERIPPLNEQMVTKMRLKDVPGIVLEIDEQK